MDELVHEHGEVLRTVIISAMCLAIVMMMVKAIVGFQMRELGQLI